jgi:hypothetical protein
MFFESARAAPWRTDRLSLRELSRAAERRTSHSAKSPFEVRLNVLLSLRNCVEVWRISLGFKLLKLQLKIAISRH